MLKRKIQDEGIDSIEENIKSLVEQVDRHVLNDQGFSNEELSEFGYAYEQIRTLSPLNRLRSPERNAALVDNSLSTLSSPHNGEALLAWTSHLGDLPEESRLAILQKAASLHSEGSTPAASAAALLTLEEAKERGFISGEIPTAQLNDEARGYYDNYKQMHRPEQFYEHYKDEANSVQRRITRKGGSYDIDAILQELQKPNLYHWGDEQSYHMHMQSRLINGGVLGGAIDDIATFERSELEHMVPQNPSQARQAISKRVRTERGLEGR